MGFCSSTSDLGSVSIFCRGFPYFSICVFFPEVSPFDVAEMTYFYVALVLLGLLPLLQTGTFFSAVLLCPGSTSLAGRRFSPCCLFDLFVVGV